MTDKELMELAKKARERAYAPYSHFTVGAALLAKSGRVYTGCNVENAAYSPSVCAERTALCKAVSEGEREFLCIAIVGGRYENIKENCTPCGVCRQSLAEFCVGGFRVLVGTPDRIKAYTLAELLPATFSLERISK